MNVQCCVGCQVCFGMIGVVLCKSLEVEIIQDVGGVFKHWLCVEYGRKSESRRRRKEGIYILQSLRFRSYPTLCWLMNTTRPRLHLAQPPGTS